MAGHAAADALDFTGLIRERTQNFTGRQWVLAAIDEWLGKPADRRAFLLAGRPGTGKTAIAARLAQISLGEIAVDGCPRLQPGFLTHMHFCQAGSEATLSPLTFVQLLSQSLANQYPRFRSALEAHGSQHIVISPVVHVGPTQSGAHVTGAVIEQVNVEIRGGDARPMFDQVVRRPLAVLCEALPHESIVILVDSLDEALSFNSDESIVQLLRLVQDFPAQVRFLLACRSNNARVFDLVGPPSLELTVRAPNGGDEVQEYAETRLSALPGPRRTALATRVAEKSRGNFLYAFHVLNELLAGGGAAGDAEPDAIDLPDELEDVYRQFLKREVVSSSARWTDMYRPLLGAIAVARGEGLTFKQLLDITALPEDRANDILTVCRQYLVGGQPGEPQYRIYHQSFRDFLLSDPDFNVFPADRHGAIADSILQRYGKSWKNCDDEYALRYAPVHLAEAARGSASGPEGRIRALVELTGNPHYRRTCQDLLRDLPMLHAHVGRAVAAAALSGDDQLLPYLVRAGRGFIEFRRGFLQGSAVIALAREGEVEKAEARLPLFDDLEQDWQVVASLIIAWLAIEQNRPAAAQIRDRVGALLTAAPPLPLLRARLSAALDGQFWPGVELQPAESLELGRQLVRRVSGQAFDRELVESRTNVLTRPGAQAELVQKKGYAASLDGPVLVHIARQHGADGTALLDEYIDAHAGYNYVQYRNRSLLVVLHAVLLHHPDESWVRARLERILDAALEGGGREFTELAPLVAAVLLEKARGGDARAVVGGFEKKAEERIGKLRARRGANDSFSVHRRRLTALMEVQGRALGDTAEAHRVWKRILELERKTRDEPGEDKVLEGFAGFQAPAELRLADALHVCGIATREAVDGRLVRALECAHHIQDFHFCARVTARCNALRRWHGRALPGADLDAAIERLARAPSDADFCADHAVNEAYGFRDPADPQMLPMDPAREANTLERLADVFQRPAVDFLRLNPDLGLTAPIAPGTVIRVPDPGFAPLLAAHLAARVLVRAPADPRRAHLIRMLAPVASPNATVLDTVLAYLLLAADPEDEGVLAEIARATGEVELADTQPSPTQIGPDPAIPA